MRSIQQVHSFDYREKVLPEKLLEILVKNKKDAEGKGIERALNILFEEQSRV